MELSLAGLVIFVALLAFGRSMGSSLIIGLFASLTFGSTAIMTLSALGGSSPLIYTPFTLLILAWVAMRPGFVDDLLSIFSRYWTAWLVGLLIVYCVASAILFPRLFAGQTTAFLSRPDMGVVEVPLAPTSGNIAQTAYFVVGALCFFAFAILMNSRDHVEIIRRGFITWSVLHASLGLVDLAGKLAGAGDILSPIRTASHAFLVDVEQSGFSRIVGGHSEASSFGIVTVACLAFTFTYWRATRLPYMLALAVTQFFLLLLSTSSSAYAGLAIVAPFAIGATIVSIARGRFSGQEAVVFACGWLAVTVALALYLFDERLFDPVMGLVEDAILNKGESGSFEQRTYWNARSVEALIETHGVGIGMGSSRASSWVIATLSQLGVVGTGLMACLVAVLLWDLISPASHYPDKETMALVSGARAATLGSLAAASISSGSADPGLIFFIALAVVVVARKKPPFFPTAPSKAGT